MHSVFVDDMAHTSTSTKLLKEFFALYAKEFSHSVGDLMTSFLGVEVEQEDHHDGCIKLHLDTYVQEMLDEYKNYIQRALKPKKIPMQPLLTKDDCSETPDPKEQNFLILSVNGRKGSVRCSLDLF